jgi:hypothetical protein
VAGAADPGQRGAGRGRVPAPPGQAAFVPFVLSVLRLEQSRVAEIAAFEQPSMFTAFGLPARLSPR